MVPPNQRLDTEHLARTEFDFRLVVKMKFVVLQSGAHALFNFKSLSCVFTKISGIFAGSSSAKCLGPIHGHVSIGEQCRDVAAVSGKDGDADAGGYSEVVAEELRLLTDGGEDFCRQQLQTGAVRYRFDHHHEFITT